MQDDQDCTDCEGSGITHQTERYCTCAAGRELDRYAAVDKPERICVAGPPEECGQYFPSCVDAEGAWGGVGVEYTRTDLCITEAECQRRIDAAVRALTEALKSSKETHVGIAQHILDGGHNTSGIFADSQRARLAIDNAIRARGQK